MFIELVDALRCPAVHEESWLVASADHMEARHIMQGSLGCPVCGATYPVEDGVVDFRPSPESALPESEAPQPERAFRLAALLDLSDTRGFAVLLGTWGAQATLLAGQVETPFLLVDPPADTVAAPGISVIRSDGEIPLATGSARGVAIDAASAPRIASAARIARPNGRLVAPASLPVPAGVHELARDGELWVGEREGTTSPIVRLHVRRG